jgi:hypothetical protein
MEKLSLRRAFMRAQRRCCRGVADAPFHDYHEFQKMSQKWSPYSPVFLYRTLLRTVCSKISLIFSFDAKLRFALLALLSHFYEMKVDNQLVIFPAKVCRLKNLLDFVIVFKIEAQIVNLICEETSGDVVDKAASKWS